MGCLPRQTQDTKIENHTQCWFVVGEASSIERRCGKITNLTEREEAADAYNAEVGRQNRLKAETAAFSRGQTNKKNELWMICKPGKPLPVTREVNKWIASCKGDHRDGITGAKAKAKAALAAAASTQR